MADQLPALVILIPLFAALLVTLVGMRFPAYAFPITAIALVATLLSCIGLFQQVLKADEMLAYFLGGWVPPSGTDGRPIPIGIHLGVDTLNGLVLIVIATVVLLSTLFAFTEVREEIPQKAGPFYALILLLTTGLLGMTITSDAFNVFVLLEVSSLTSYGLIAMGPSRRGSLAAYNYVIIGTIGASFFLLGVGYLFAKTGTLNMLEIQYVLSQDRDLQGSRSILVAFALIMMGFWIKMALFPLHGWLPNAYSYSLSSAGAVLAPLVTKVSIYVMIRMIITVFGVDYVFQEDVVGGFRDAYLPRVASHVVVWMAVVAIIAGSFLALAQTELKRMLCYLIVVEVGYMVGGVWLNHEWGMAGAAYHIVSDAMMTLCLFLAAGLYFRRTQDYSIASLEQPQVKQMPYTMAGFICGALAIVGVPPTCGFFSKWYLIRGGMESGHWEYVVALLVSSLINAILFFRVFEVMLFGAKPQEVHAHKSVAKDTMKLSLPQRERLTLGHIALFAAALSLFGIGIFNTQIVAWIQQSLPMLGN